MDKPKILWVTIDRSKKSNGYLYDNYLKAAKLYCDVEVVEKNNKFDTRKNRINICNKKLDPGRILDNISKEFDFIFCDNLHMFLTEKWKNINIPVGALFQDIHDDISKQHLNVGIKNDMWLFTTSNIETLHKFNEQTKEYKRKFWLPPCVDLKDYKKLDKKRKVVLLGSMKSKHYPYRKLFLEQLEDQNFFKRIPCPGPNITDESWPVRNDYFDLLSESEILTTSGGDVNYTVMKYFDASCCRTAICSPWFESLHKIGFEPGKNIIVSDFSNLINQLLNTLEDTNKLRSIQESARKLMEERHTIEIRGKQFLQFVTTAIKESNP